MPSQTILAWVSTGTGKPRWSHAVKAGTAVYIFFQSAVSDERNKLWKELNLRQGYFAERGKLSRDNFRKIKCGTFRKLSLIAFPNSAAEKFCIFVDCKTTICSHCTTDVQPMHSSVLRPTVPSFCILCGPFAKEQGIFLQFRSVILKHTGTMAPILLVVGGAMAELAQALVPCETGAM